MPTDLPDGGAEAIEFLARARLVAGLLGGRDALGRLDTELEAHTAVVDDPRPDDYRDPAPLAEAARDRWFGGTDRAGLGQAVLCRSPSRGALFVYLFTTARDAVARASSSGRRAPSRAEVLLGASQCALLTRGEWSPAPGQRAGLPAIRRATEILLWDGQRLRPLPGDDGLEPRPPGLTGREIHGSPPECP
jgi:hypothetical protein